jgi:hypothetical protein
VKTGQKSKTGQNLQNGAFAPKHGDSGLPAPVKSYFVVVVYYYYPSFIFQYVIVNKK